MAATDTLSKANGFGSVHEAPDLPQWFTELFESYVVPAGGLNVRAVIGGKGPPFLLLAGWPQSWYAWRLLMPALAERFTVIAVDPRGGRFFERRAACKQLLLNLDNLPI